MLNVNSQHPFYIASHYFATFWEDADDDDGDEEKEDDNKSMDEKDEDEDLRALRYAYHEY